MTEAYRAPYFVKEVSSLYSARGSLLVVESMPGIKYGEIVEVETASGEVRYGQVIDVSKDATVIQVFGGVKEVDLKRSTVRFKGETFKLPLSLDMLGRTFDGLGRPIDGGPPIIPEDYADINGAPINPAARQPPSEFIETGISAIDGLNSLVRGQKLPIFSGSGLPHNRIAAQIVRQATVKGKGESFAIVFAAIGVTFDDARFFIKNFEETGALERTVVFINTASDPTVERIAAPRVALTTAEFLAWKHDMHVLVILTDMTNYCEALREMSAAREEVPGRRGYPGYMYSVDGSRRIVILDEKGLLRIVTLAELFDELSKKSKVLRDPLGFEEKIRVKGIYALSVSRDGVASFKPVKYIIRHKYYGKMVKIRTPLGETIVTPNHSIFTIENNKLKTVEAGKLKKGDLIAHIRFLPKFKKLKNISIDLAKLMGYYVAEGHATKGVYYDKRRKKYYVHQYVKIDNTDLGIIKDVMNSFINEFNIQPSIIVSDKVSNTLRVSTGRRKVYGLLIERYRLGSKAKEKTVPSEILSSDIKCQKAFFEAFYAGNGKSQDPRYKIKQYDIITISERLRDTMIWLVKQLFPERYPVIYKWPKRNVWKIYLSTRLRAKHITLNDVVAVEVKSLEYVDPTDNWVYDLSVEDNENFVEACGGIVLHNTDLATMYERAGRIWGKKGSVTIMPILTMPDDDITHPIPDLTGYITEGQLVLSRDLHRKGIYPPMDVFLSLSRLMKEGIGPGKTREDHRGVFMQLYAAYAEGQHLRELSVIVGTEALSERDKKYLKFADEFEARFIKQGEYERRTIEETLDIAWDLLSIIPEEDLKLIREEFIRKYHPKYREKV